LSSKVLDTTDPNALLLASAPGFEISNKTTGVEKKRQGVEAIKIQHGTRKTSIAFIILGMWAPLMPPYNLARLIAITRAAGYKTYGFDYNIDSYNYLKYDEPDMEQAWAPNNYWWWDSVTRFNEKVLPSYKSFLDEYIEELLSIDTDMYGFTVYHTNRHATDYVAREIKERKPESIILYGGPECMNVSWPDEIREMAWVDYSFVGESEQNLFDFLEEWEKGEKPKTQLVGKLFGKKRADLDSFPFPDYSDFPLEMYSLKKSVCTELTRGCVARCTYCQEVLYWKFRDRESFKVVEEIMWQHKEHGISFVYFADSLMNGNVKEFKNFLECKIKADPNMKITWVGYLRADHRMDDEFYDLLWKAGGRSFNYGFESGSQKVLDGINKKSKLDDINRNIISAEKYNVNTVALWIIGAPEEDHEAFAHSFNMIWNHRRRLHSIAPGTGLWDIPGTAYDDREKFNLNERDNTWFGAWFTKDLKNTRFHRYLRVKHMHIWIKICNDFETPIVVRGDNKNKRILNSHETGDVLTHFNISWSNPSLRNDELEYEHEFDYNVINSDLGDFANSVMNEVFVLLRMIWRARGGFNIKLKYDTAENSTDWKEFEYMFDAGMHYHFKAEIDFSINEHGKFKINNTYNYHEKETAHMDMIDGNGAIDRSFEYTHLATGQW